MADQEDSDERIILEVGGLAVYGPDLDPEDVTARLGCQPTRAHRRGDTKRQGAIPFPSGAWFLETRDVVPSEPEHLVRRLLLRLPMDASVWESLSNEYQVPLRFGIHFSGWNNGFVLPSDLVITLATRRVTMSFDGYAYGDDDA